MSDLNRYGRIVSALDVETAIVASLNIWLDSALGEAERLFGYEANQIVRPLGIVTSTQWQKWAHDQVPVVLVLNGGLAGPPVRRAEGKYDASWVVTVSPVVSDTDLMSTRELMLVYVTAIRLALLQHKMFKSELYPNGFADFTSWRDESYDFVPVLATRSLNAGAVVLEVGVSNVLTEQAGPKTPPVNPAVDPGPWPTVAPGNVRVTAVPLSPTEVVK